MVVIYRCFLSRIGGRIKQAGFSLVEIAIVLLLVGLLAYGGVGLLGGLVKRKQYADTRTALELVNANLVLFVARSHRLPCAADGLGNTGTEARDSVSESCLSVSTGVAPWLTLGMPQADALDGWGNRITYRVAGELVINDAMNLSACDPAGTGAAVGVSPRQSCASTCANQLWRCTPLAAVLVNKGLTVRNRAGQVQADPGASSGAAYVLISHGENQHGAYSSAGVLQVGSPAAGSAELVNANGQGAQPYYVADLPDYTVSAARFDDLVSFVSVHSVAALARLDARSH